MTDAIGTVTMYPKLERREWIFGTAPDPRDARIAELEAALSSVRDDLSSWRISFPSHCSTMRTIDAALMLPPESDMTITQEELPA